MNTKKVTSAVIGLVFLFLIAYDIFVAVEKTPNDTLSEVIANWSYTYPVIPFCWGILAAHFFIHRDSKKYMNKFYANISRYFILAATIGTFIIIPYIFPNFPLWLSLILGAGAGYEFWPQFKANVLK